MPEPKPAPAPNLERDFICLLYAALHINDRLEIKLDHVEVPEMSMNDVKEFRLLVNDLHYIYRGLCEKIDPDDG